jgi:hypothetical protein
MSDLVYQNYNNKCQGWTNPANLMFGPQINSLSGYQSPSGSSTVVAINGSNFYSYSIVRFGTFTPTVYFINSNLLEFYVPNTLSSGNFNVQVCNGSICSNMVNYTIDNASGYWLLNPGGSISNTNPSNVIPLIGGGLTVNGNINQILKSSGSTTLGTNSLSIGSTGIDNTIIGNNCGNNITSGQENTFVGQQSGINNTSGNQNTFIGQQSGYTNITGSDNVYIGEHSGYSATGNNNTFVGQDSGSSINSGSYNTCIGQGSNINTGSGPISNSTAIGYNATITSSNQIVLGTTAEAVYIPSTLTGNPYALQVDGDVNIIGSCYAAGFNPPSDYRIKDIIEHITIDKDEYIIDNLKPVKYFNNLTKNVEIGFIAHEVQEIFPYLVIGDKDATELQRLNYNSLLGILVKEIQNLKQEIKLLKNTK